MVAPPQPRQRIQLALLLPLALAIAAIRNQPAQAAEVPVWISDEVPALNEVQRLLPAGTARVPRPANACPRAEVSLSGTVDNALHILVCNQPDGSDLRASDFVFGTESQVEEVLRRALSTMLNKPARVPPLMPSAGAWFRASIGASVAGDHAAPAVALGLGWSWRPRAASARGTLDAGVTVLTDLPYRSSQTAFAAFSTTAARLDAAWGAPLSSPSARHAAQIWLGGSVGAAVETAWSAEPRRSGAASTAVQPNTDRSPPQPGVMPELTLTAGPAWTLRQGSGLSLTLLLSARFTPAAPGLITADTVTYRRRPLAGHLGLGLRWGRPSRSTSGSSATAGRGA